MTLDLCSKPTHVSYLQHDCCRGSKSKHWERKQVRPYPDGNGSWEGKVFGVQCFFGFTSLDSEQDNHTATFGAWLHDDAIEAVREWLDTVKFTKAAQVQHSLTCREQPVRDCDQPRLKLM